MILITPKSLHLIKEQDIFSKIIIKTFPDGENYLKIPTSIRGKRIILIHCCYPEPDRSLVQLFLILQHLKKEGAAFVRAVIPYLPYSRKNKIYLEGEVLSSKIICNLIAKNGCDELVTFDCHFLNRAGTFSYSGLRIVNRSMGGQIIAFLREELKNPMIIAPDEGAAYFLAGEEDTGIIRKKRGSYVNSGVERHPEIEMTLDVKDRDVILIDDIIGLGDTMYKAVEACRENGVRNIACGATHGFFFNGAFERLNEAGVKQIVCSDSIPNPVSKVSIIDALKDML